MTTFQILSDLHLEFRPFTLKTSQAADAIIIAGDISTTQFLKRYHYVLSEARKPVFVVLGNHEAYGVTLDIAKNDVKELLKKFPNVTLLDDSYVDFEDVRIVGGTLWPNFELPMEWHKGQPAFSNPKLAMDQARRGINDFTVIHGFTPEMCVEMHNKTREAIIKAKKFKGDVVVVTHFLPSPKSVDPKFANSPLNPYFASDCEDLMGDNVKLWHYGHTHSSSDYFIKGTHLVCNPRGYHEYENTKFNSTLCVTVK